MNDSMLGRIREILEVPERSRVTVTKVSKGWNIRIHEPIIPKVKTNTQGIEKSLSEVMIEEGYNHTVCEKCGSFGQYCHAHHIIPRSAGGLNDFDNGVFLCMNCHTGNNGIHLGKWKIEELIEEKQLILLKRRYGLI